MHATSHYIPPEALDMLCTVFDELLQECHAARNSQEAENLAARLIAIYQSGVRDLELLKNASIPFTREG
ncbi:hypothetical protein SFGR64A_14720 [Sinorhizobium fredii GR64]|nr:hypothetical protein SFGR64A_14720 [Sinorhizobium fredii GR64]